MKKRIASVLMAAIMLAVYIFASGASYVSNSDSLDAEASVRLDVFDVDSWNGGEGVSDITVRRSGSSNALYVMAEKRAKTMTFVFEPDEMPDLSGFNELCFDLSASAKGKFSIGITYHTPTGTYDDKAEEISSGRTLVRFVLPSEATDAGKITLHIEAENIIQSCTLLGIYGDSFRSYSYIDRFEAVRATLPENAVSYDSHISLIPSKDVSYIRFHRELPYDGETVLVTVRIKSALSGVMSLRCGDEGEVRSVSVYNGEADYCAVLSGVGDIIDVGFHASESDGVRSVDVVSLHTVVLDERKATVGSVESCVFDGKKVRLTGSLPSDTVVDHIKSRLALYKIPSDSTSPYELTEEEAEISISTSFTISAAVDYDHTRYKYLVAIVDKNKITPVTDPVYAYETSERPSPSKGCAVGLSNADAVTVFASEAQKVVLDVEVPRLFVSPAEGVKTVRINYHDTAYYVSREYIDELDNHISFSLSASTSVSLRLLCGEAEMTSDAMKSLCAAASYLAERYSDVDSMIFLSDYPYKGDAESALAASELLASLVGAVRHKDSDCGVMMAVSDGGVTSCVMTAYYNKFVGVKDVGLYFEGSMSSGTVVRAVVMSDNASAVGSVFKETVIFCRDYVESQYKPVYDAASKASVSAVIYSLGSVSDSKVSEIVNDLSSSKTIVYQFDLYEGDVQYTGEYSVWNFRDSYDTFGWLSGGSCLAPQTALATDGKGRAMKSVISPDMGEEGVLVCRLDKVTDFSRADNMSLDIWLDVPEGVKVPLKVVLGATGAKAEYSAEISGGEGTISLDLGGFLYANRIEYVAVIVDVETKSSLEIMDVRLTSERLSSEALREYVAPTVNSVKDMLSLYIFFGAVASATVIIFVILTKKRSTGAKIAK